jgi:Fe2+ transport system protein FeoA
MFDVITVRRGFERLRAARTARTGRARPYTPAVLTLADMRAGETARIACVQCTHAARCERLQAYGLAQGQLVTLLQSSPAFVLRVDETELALDADVARCVQIERQWSVSER